MRRRAREAWRGGAPEGRARARADAARGEGRDGRRPHVPRRRTSSTTSWTRCAPRRDVRPAPRASRPGAVARRERVREIPPPGRSARTSARGFGLNRLLGSSAPRGRPAGRAAAWCGRKNSDRSHKNFASPGQSLRGSRRGHRTPPCSAELAQGRDGRESVPPFGFPDSAVLSGTRSAALKILGPRGRPGSNPGSGIGFVKALSGHHEDPAEGPAASVWRPVCATACAPSGQELPALGPRPLDADASPLRVRETRLGGGQRWTARSPREDRPKGSRPSRRSARSTSTSRAPRRSRHRSWAPPGRIATVGSDSSNTSRARPLAGGGGRDGGLRRNHGAGSPAVGRHHGSAADPRRGLRRRPEGGLEHVLDESDPTVAIRPGGAQERWRLRLGALEVDVDRALRLDGREPFGRSSRGDRAVHR